MLIKTGLHLHKNRQLNQWNGIDNEEINLCTQGQLIFKTGAKNTQKGKDMFFHKWCLENWISTHKKWNWTLILHYTQDQLKTD